MSWHLGGPGWDLEPLGCPHWTLVPEGGKLATAGSGGLLAVLLSCPHPGPSTGAMGTDVLTKASRPPRASSACSARTSPGSRHAAGSR